MLHRNLKALENQWKLATPARLASRPTQAGERTG